MSHATARPRQAGTSFESQAQAQAGRRLESQPAGASQRYDLTHCQLLVDRVVARRQQELARMLALLPPADRVRLTGALRQLVAVAGEGYGTISRGLVPV